MRRRHGLVVAGALSLVLVATEVSAAPSPSPGANPAPTPGATPSPVTKPAFPDARDRAPAGVALAALPARAKLPTPTALRPTLNPWVGAKALKPRVGFVALTAGGQAVYDHAGATSYVPASTTKLLTTAAALRQLGPGHRFVTSVYDADASDGADAIHTIVLLGGGDPLLSSRKVVARRVADKRFTRRTAAGLATIDDLAERTATALREQGISKVRVRFDDRLFGPGVSRHWHKNYLSSGEVSRVSALTVDQGRSAVTGDLRVADPAGRAANLFAAGLAKHRLKVIGGANRGRAPKRQPIASVTSPPLDRIVEHVLLTSDNDGAEMLLRQTAIDRGQPATFAGGAKATRASLSALGLGLSGLKLFDGSGLSPANRISPSLLTRLLATAMSSRHPELAAVLSGLPVAGVSGTLADRFHVVGTNGAGLVRGKTGTLNFVSALAGIAQTADGAVLAFAFLADSLHADARPYEERVTALLTACGCRKRPTGGGG
jgi:D-alanyl-D-alanine carboxypeptidase/D-alanyl-D-alanine-endopeptidase (penicillin-binding protein 4)